MTLVGIDGGASIIKAGRFTPTLHLEQSVTVPSGAARGWVAYFDSIAVAAEEVGARDMRVLGLAVPALLSKDGRAVRGAANIARMGPRYPQTINIEDQIMARLAVRSVVVENDANCAALAEWQCGRGGGDPAVSVLHITWGTGIGTAFITAGHIQYGWEGGHMPLSWGRGASVACGCGSRRDLEAYCAVPYLVQQSHLAPKELLAAAQAGAGAARTVVDSAVRWLARGLHMMSVLVYPDVVTIGGGFMAADWLLGRLQEEVEREGKKGRYLSDALRPDMVVRAKLGNEAGMIGAALLAKRRYG